MQLEHATDIIPIFDLEDSFVINLTRNPLLLIFIARLGLNLLDAFERTVAKHCRPTTLECEQLVKEVARGGLDRDGGKSQ